MLLSPQSVSEPEVPAVLPPSLQGIEELSEAVAGLSTMEEVMQYLEPERWQVDLEELYKPTWHVLGKSFILNKKARGRTFLTCTLQLNYIEMYNTVDMSLVSRGSDSDHSVFSVFFEEELISIS